jgi:hypothetical protein
MLRRHAISDEQWERIKDFLPGQGKMGKWCRENGVASFFDLKRHHFCEK